MIAFSPGLLDDNIAFEAQLPARPKIALNVWRINLLVIDDNEADLALILRALKDHPDLGRVDASTDPVETLNDLRRGRFNPTLILLDLRMPALNGFEFLAALQKIPAMTGVPVVILTTSAFQRDAEQARLTTACGYIVKPDSIDQLKSQVDAVLNQVLVRHRR